MKLQPGQAAKDFVSIRIDGELFKLSDYKGRKILLSFFRNGACALCNLRIHELIRHYDDFRAKGINVVAVFESSIADMMPYVGKQKPPFVLLADPEGKIYEVYAVESSEEKVNAVIATNVAESRIHEASSAGFVLTKQEGSNFFRLPADILISEDFLVLKSHYSNHVIDHLPIPEILAS